SYEWKDAQLEIEPLPIPSKVDLFATIPESKVNIKESITYFRDISIEKLYVPRVFAMEQGNPVQQSQVDFTKVNPSEYSGKVKSDAKGYFLIFNDNYSSDWELKINGKANNFPHFTVNGFANGWYVPAVGNGVQSLNLYYKPQALFNFGLVILISTVIIYIIILCKKWLRR